MDDLKADHDGSHDEQHEDDGDVAALAVHLQILSAWTLLLDPASDSNRNLFITRFDPGCSVGFAEIRKRPAHGPESFGGFGGIRPRCSTARTSPALVVLATQQPQVLDCRDAAGVQLPLAGPGAGSE